MVDFTTIISRGIRRHIDKNIKNRRFGKCELCERPALLIEYENPKSSVEKARLCEFCYTEVLNSET